MTTHTSPLPQGARDNFDTGPLSWVMGEVREALTRSKTALVEASSQDAEARSTSLRHAKTYLHQAHGALQIVDVDGVAIVTETIEDLLERLEAGQIEFASALVQAIENAYQAIVEYLEELLLGTPPQPVRLFPYYRALLEVRGAERIHPADLFFPNLAIRPHLPAASAAPRAIEYGPLRQRFERALLPFLRSTDQGAELGNATVMRDIIGEVEASQSNLSSRAFWWVMYGFAEVVAAGQIRNELYVKQLFARINLQLRRLSSGSFSIGERLLRDALFFIAKAQAPPPRALQIRKVYQLDGLVPVDYETKRYGQIDVAALVQAKERLSQAKYAWNRLTAGDGSAADAFEQEMDGLTETGAKLNSPSLLKLLGELRGIAHKAAHATGESLGVEIAASLLFVENALEHASRLSDNFSERADAMTARLLSVIAGEQPSGPSPWMDDMSRDAQQRQTMMVLSGEMQSSLRQVEKMLEEYFGDLSKRSALPKIDSVLHQIEGALAILDQTDAMQAIRHTRAAINRFSEAEEMPHPHEFQQVAQNVGALSFFIETLQLQSDVKKRFIFDEKLGVFHANLLAKKDLPQDAADITMDEVPVSQAPDSAMQFEPAAASSSDFPTVEVELAYQQRHSAKLAGSLVAEPDNPGLQVQLKQSLESILLDATLIDSPEVKDRAQAAIDILERPDFIASEDTIAEIVSAMPAAPSPAPVVVGPVAPLSDEAIDAELLEIFLAEAEEVLQCVTDTLPALKNEPHNQGHLATLRRSFHTLKGSGRMVGLMSFGDAAWGIEQVLNLRLSEGQGGSPNLYALLEKATEILGGWVQDLQTQGSSLRTPNGLARAAERVKNGELFSYDERATAVVGPAATPVAAESAAVELVAELPCVEFAMATAAEIAGFEMDVASAIPQAEEAQMSDADLAAFHFGRVEQPEKPADSVDTVEVPTTFELPDAPAAVPYRMPVAEVIDFPGALASQARHDDTVKRIGDLEISVPLYNIYLAETDELVRLLSQDIAEWRHEPERHVNILAVHAAHSLAGSSATVGFNALHEVAHALEMILQLLARQPVPLALAEFDTLEQGIGCLKQMLQKFAMGEMPSESAQAKQLEKMRQGMNDRSGLTSSAVSSVPAFSIVHLESDAPATWAPIEAAVDTLFDTSFDTSFDTADADLLLPERAVQVPQAAATAAEEIEVFAAAAAPTMQVTNLAAARLEPAPLREDETSADQTLVIEDDLDVDLLPVFLEEGQDILPQMGQFLRSWHQTPADLASPQALLRLLHTIKGSARMAGAMRLGQHMHELESRIEQITRSGTPPAESIEDLLARLDFALQVFDQLLNPGSSKPAQTVGSTPAEQVVEAAAAEAKVDQSSNEMVTSSSVMPIAPSKMAASLLAPVAPAERVVVGATAGPVALVRVRADILDRMVNQAGEVSISRSRVETEVGTLRTSLLDLTENVARLRDQLREIEIQAETQITSQMAQSADREFDPLEFDRFTRLQELTRMMAESVNDVASVQQNLMRTVEGATIDLTAQARLTRDLQQDLMRVRMVQFASVSERLYRVTRQAAKEIDKRVNLDIRGSSVEIDRSVLERMAGPFEHLLRNAIVHGIETREGRIAAGKNETGELRVEIRQAGNEVIIQFSDDGRGLNLARLREKARATGLLTVASEMSDAEVTDLIFHPGFSTASVVTELAGRGVGLDVVRSEVAALGGRVAIMSEPGQGAHFVIQLPLTLAVTQAVLLSTGGKTYAVPSVLVEQVQQLKANRLAAAYNDGAVMWQGERVPMHYLSALLGDKDATPLAQQYSPMVILKSGNDRVALHVDEVIGNREVVVKNIGPQLARMIGIAGATVLGSGDIVLILDPVPLALKAAHEIARAPRILPPNAPDNMGAVAEMAAPTSAPPKVAEPVQGLRTQNIVMVVDDSLTVRRVTQRFLSREGYQVVLAKDGVDALEQLQAITPDVMLVDIEMPRMDGFDLTRNVRSDERTRHIPIIMITSRTAIKHRNYAMELGVNEYLGKPYQEADLLKLVRAFLNKEAPVA